MEIEFARSDRSSIGIEWEIACVDHASGELTPAAPAVFAALGTSGTFPHVATELLTNTVEVVSDVHDRVSDAVDDLATTIEAVREVVDPLGVDLLCAGTHPFSQWFQQEVTPGKERYATLIDRTRWWGRQMMIWGVHVHIGIERREKVLPILNGLLAYVPHFQALSASSPHWVGEATGYASNRALLFQQLPTAGLPPQFGAWANYEEMLGDMTHTGVIDHFSELRWDIRPSPKWGTIEVRVFDGVSSVREVAALAALVQCLVEEFSEHLDRGEDIPQLQPWYVRENKWRAARYGMDAIIIQDAAGNECPVQEDTRRVLARLERIAERLGCLEELRGVARILERGASYQRQLAVAADHAGSLKAVVGHLVSELRDDSRG